MRRNIFKANFNAIGDAFDLLDDGIRQWIRFTPEGSELFFDPGYAFGRGTFPEDFIVLPEGALRFVDVCL